MRVKPSVLYKLLLLNVCFSISWSAGSPIISSLELASNDNGGFTAPFVFEGAAPIIEHALDQIDKAKNVQNLLGSVNNSANKNCTNCEEEVRNIRYMQCSPQNNYLENELEQTSQGESLLAEMIRGPVIADSIIKPMCMRMSMESRFSASSKVFRQCSADGSSSKVFRPCISENYFKLINNSFNLVSTCMKDIIAPNESEDMKALDVRAVYALINVESGFHVNAMSPTGAGGIGQFTSSAIQDVNVNELHDIRIQLEGHSNPRCNRLSMEFLDSLEPMSPQKSKSCDRISLQNGNPIKNMIYTYAYLRGIKEDLDKMIFDNKNYRNKFRLSKYDMNKVKRALMVWAHNAGPAGTWTPAKTLLNTLYRNESVTNADVFINQMQQFMHKFPASANKSTARRSETSKYFPSITNTLNKIEKNAGGGSCVN